MYGLLMKILKILKLFVNCNSQGKRIIYNPCEFKRRGRIKVFEVFLIRKKTVMR